MPLVLSIMVYNDLTMSCFVRSQTLTTVSESEHELSDETRNVKKIYIQVCLYIHSMDVKYEAEVEVDEEEEGKVVQY